MVTKIEVRTEKAHIHSMVRNTGWEEGGFGKMIGRTVVEKITGLTRH